jgi:phosphonate transport system ATP-binding protein
MSQEPPVFVLRDVSRAFGRFMALRRVSLEVRQGERVALMGPSGSGKTTFLGLLNGTLRPTSGEVLVLGHDLGRLGRGPRRGVLRQIGTIYQQFHIVDSLRVIHNVNAGHLGRWSTLRAALSLLRPLERETARRALERVGIPDKLYARTGRLSGGEQQRVALARVLVQDPRAVLADEPISNLDPERGREVMDVLRDISRQAGKTLVASVHNLSYVKTHFTRVVGLSGGAVTFDCPASELSTVMAGRLYQIEQPDREASAAPAWAAGGRTG